MRPWIAVASALAASVGLGFTHPFGNPREASGPSLHEAPMSASAKAVLASKCADCHSAQTHWPVYARLAPASWLIERDIVHARRALDISRWGELSSSQQQTFASRIVREAKSGDMPPLQYRLLHPHASLSQVDIRALTTLLESSAIADTDATPEGDSTRGKAVFEKRCTGCHALNENREGPRLAGVFNRKAGSVSGFPYSPALKASGITWTDATLERWLTDTDLMVPENNMDFHVARAQERKDLIAFLKQ